MAPIKENKNKKKWIAAILLFIIAFLSAGHAVTLAWLSGFPEQVSRHQELQDKALLYWLLALACFIPAGLLAYSAIKAK